MDARSSGSGSPSTTEFRLVMLGDQGVGKSSITHRLVKDEFTEQSAPTIGAAYINKSFKIEDITVKLDLWDTAGQERFASLAPMYYRTAQTAVVTYDVCRKASFQRAMEWVRELRNQAPPTVLIALCGNKVDVQRGREVSSKEGQDMATDQGLMFFEVSAKTGQGVRNMFHTIAETLISNLKSNRPDSHLTREERNIRLSQNNPDEKKCPC